MSGNGPSLEQLQRWMQCVIMHPGGVSEGLSAPEAREHLDVAAGTLEDVITRSRALDSLARLEIYVDAYYERLLECLGEEFIATRKALGDELFNALAFGYLQQYPSRSYTLGMLGAYFPRYLGESRLHERATPGGAGPSWPELVIELAQLERSMREVFDGPGSEDAPGLDAGELVALGAERWLALRLAAAECLRLHRFDHPVHSYWAALKHDAGASPPEPQVTYLAINRRQFTVEQHELLPAQFTLLSELAAGQTLGQALERAAEMPGADWQSLEQNLATWFAQWTSQRFFVALRPTDRQSGPPI